MTSELCRRAFDLIRRIVDKNLEELVQSCDTQRTWPTDPRVRSEAIGGSISFFYSDVPSYVRFAEESKKLMSNKIAKHSIRMGEGLIGLSANHRLLCFSHVSDVLISKPPPL